MKHFLYLTFLLIISLTTKAQQRIISGNVSSSADSGPIPGASVYIKGTTHGSSTDVQGNFRLTFNKGTTLIISAIGYQTQEVALNKSNQYVIRLESAANQLGEIEVVGSRNASRTRTDSPVPVDVIDLKPLKESAPQVSITQLLQYVSPSFHSVNGSNAGDAGSALNLSQLRGLGVDQVLVLVNGKRRHKSSNVNWGGLGNGATGYDLNSIPTGSIERVEILRDGAAAQYGSDAIAGVINIVLRKSTDELTATSTVSTRRRGDGTTTRTSANYGFSLGNKGGFFNATAEFATQGISLTPGKDDSGLYNGPIYGGGANTRAYDAIYTKEIDEAILAKRGIDRHFFDQRGGGSNKAKDALLFFNAAIPLKEEAEIYAFGGISHRSSQFTAVYRLPGWTERTNSFLYPDGFLPAMENIITDKSLTLGIKGKVHGWNVDFSNVYGKNDFGNVITNSINASLGLKSPTTFDAGKYNASQNTASLDFSRYFDRVLKGLNVALGAQYRVETYQIIAGEEASYSKADLRTIYDIDTTAAGIPYLNNAGSIGLNGLSPGSQIHAGFRPANEVNVNRAISAGYLDLEANLTQNWLLSGAFRVENFSDFGNVTTYKVATRYKFSNWLSIRASHNTGFRAPDLAQFYYTETSTSFQQGRAIDQVTASNKSAATRALGFPSLTPEKSKGYTFGFTSQPVRNLELTADAYLVEVNNRVGNTGNFSATDTNLPLEVRTLFVQTGTTQAKFFYNSFSTRTKGIEFTGSYKTPFRSGQLTLLVGGNFVKNEVTNVHTPKGLEAYRYIIFNEGEKARVTSNIPGQKITLQAFYRQGRFNYLLRTVYFGSVTTATALNATFPRPDYFFQKLNPIWVTDASVGYRVSSAIQVTAGVNNLFNQLGDYSQVVSLRNPTVVGIQNGSAGIQPFARLSVTF
ncbi:TonB-dependent receptor [Siphonobacter sp. SORGH_AS_0500]|uniref:TonB-dependent receptor n=1 Tax=Siphonobacter sp. SORGH_AS_0500 TaxID=1864824 RepID=UPI0028645E06|nr:TonB-dependent receptor [Siphonobacter sp. SORGH_AS_0500]MDR6197831.1 iron complex outermembrane receptor protein [Siphonobacter sp. SORGH_AS_0500]